MQPEQTDKQAQAGSKALTFNMTNHFSHLHTFLPNLVVTSQESTGRLLSNHCAFLFDIYRTT